MTTPNSVAVGTTTSTESGEFTFAYVPAGEYRLIASAPGLMSADATPIQPQGGKPIKLSEGQQLADIELGLVPMLAIEGRVVDQSGAPVSAVPVSLSQVRFVPDTLALVPLAVGKVVNTDLEGKYRFVDLLPGDYYVRATAGALGRLNLSDPTPTPQPDALLAYVPTYFPGTDRIFAARPVRVEIGINAFDVSFAMSPATLAAVAGTVSDANGQPAPNVAVTLFQTDAGQIRSDLVSQTEAGQIRSNLGARARTDADGKFAFSAIPTGTYVLEAVGSGGFGSRPVSILNRDELAGVDVSIRPPIRARGRFTFEGGRPPDVSLVRARVVATDLASGAVLGVLPLARSGVVGFFASSREPTNRFEGDWTFEIGPLSWHGLIRVTAPAPWALKSVLLNGRDITDEPSDFRSADVAGLELVMTNRLGSISGTVTDGSRPAASLVLVLPEDQTKRSLPSRFPNTTYSAPDGSFKLTGLPAGRYRAIAINPPTTFDLEWLRSLHALATPVIVSEIESKTVALKLVR